jgi:glycosyltransferase involved in cell wall biosynthesis
MIATSRPLQEQLFELWPVRLILAVVFLCRGWLRLRRRQLYRGLGDLCWVLRVSRIPTLQRLARREIFARIPDLRRRPSPLVESYLADPASTDCASLYALTGKGSHDLFRDVIVLKKATVDEKGVILLKYARTFDAVVAMFDLDRLMEQYRFVLEPCWAGYADPSLLMYLTANQPVFVQCFTEEDFTFVRDVGEPFVPLRLGPADWVDADVFAPVEGVGKDYDLVMVANWAPHKRHAQLFRALRDIHDVDVRVLLIGFPWGGRTAEDIRREAASIGNPRVHVDVIESVPPGDVAKHVSRCKAFVFLSRKEGDNKALVEALFTDVPAIVYANTIGGAGSRINQSTGMFATDAELPATIRFMLSHYADFTPRAWVKAHSGSAVATSVLNDAIKRAVIAQGGRFGEGLVEKTNAPNLTYKDPRARLKFQADYEFILSCRRGAPIRSAVA